MSGSANFSANFQHLHGIILLVVFVQWLCYSYQCAYHAVVCHSFTQNNFAVIEQDDFESCNVERKNSVPKWKI